MSRSNVPARALAALALAAASLMPHQAIAGAPPIQRVTLANGMRVVLAPDPMATGVDVAVWHPLGTRHERAGQAGITHLVERLSFRGSAQVRDGEHRDRVLAEGGTINTSMSADHLAFWQTVPSEALAATLALEADRMAGLAPSATAFEEEKREAVLDRSRAERTPVARGLSRLWAEAYTGHPYARPLTGVEADVRGITLAAAQQWRRERFAAGSAVLTVVGRFEPEPTLDRIRTLFAKLPAGARVVTPAAKVTGGEMRRVEEVSDIPVRVLFTGFRGPGSNDPDALAMEMLAQSIGAGESPHLLNVLGQEWGLALAAQAGFDVRLEGSLFWTLTALREDADGETTERALRDELGRIAREGLDEQVVARVKRLAETRTLFAAQGVRSRAQLLGEAELWKGDAGLAEQRLARIHALTAADLQRAARRLFAHGAHAVVWMRPGGPGGAR